MGSRTTIWLVYVALGTSACATSAPSTTPSPVAVPMAGARYEGKTEGEWAEALRQALAPGGACRTAGTTNEIPTAIFTALGTFPSPEPSTLAVLSTAVAVPPTGSAFLRSSLYQQCVMAATRLLVDIGPPGQDVLRAALRSGPPAFGVVAGLQESGTAARSLAPAVVGLLRQPGVDQSATVGLTLLRLQLATDLLPLLSDADLAVRERALATLRVIAPYSGAQAILDQPVLDALAARARVESDLAGSQAIGQTLGLICVHRRGPDAAQTVCGLTDSQAGAPSKIAGAWAVAGCSHRWRDEAPPRLVALLDDVDPLVAKAAQNALRTSFSIDPGSARAHISQRDLCAPKAVSAPPSGTPPTPPLPQ